VVILISFKRFAYMALYIPTPLITSKPLSSLTGKEVFLKLEALQPSGSFKARGIGVLCKDLASKGFSQFISSSGGNAGIAVAYAGSQLGIPVRVVVPETTSLRAKEIIASFGADVTVLGASWQEAHRHAESLVDQKSALVHPFDHPLIWKGHSTLIDEIVSSGIHPDAIIVSVGGGGLYCGVVNGLKGNSLIDVCVIAAETSGMASFHEAIRRGEHCELETVSGVATSLGAKKVAAQAFALQKEHPTRSVIVSDKRAISACMRFMDDHRLLVEPACGAALAVLYDQLPELASCKIVVCVVCGGSTVTAEQLRSYSLTI
jgi:L-serine/L-threonine ammonia-lyase